MIKSREHQELESSCRLTFHVCKAVFEDQNSYAVVYGIKGVDEVGNLRVHIRERKRRRARAASVCNRLCFCSEAAGWYLEGCCYIGLVLCPQRPKGELTGIW